MKFLRVDMSKLTCSYEENTDYEGLAGRALTSTIVSREVPPNAHPLHEENKLIIAPGFLTGTPAPSTGRFSIGGKSPLTRGIKECNSGGVTGHKLACLGIDAVIIEGKPENEDELHLLHISKEGATFTSADNLRGLGNYETVAKLTETYGAKVGYLTIGPGGEMKLLTGNIASNDPENIPTRGARRGGLGSVMRSKGLKAIVTDDTGCPPIEIKDRKQFNQHVKEAVKEMRENPLTGQAMPAMGTTCLVNIVNSMGAMPTQNFRKGMYESAEKISGERILELTMSRGESGKKNRRCCYGCPIGCSRYWLNEEGERIGKRPEYEVLWSHSANLLIDDLDKIVEMCDLEDDYGVDGMDVGMALSVLMEAGIIKWGDADRCLEVVKKIGSGDYLGRIIGCGAELTARVFGVDRVATSKGQSLSGYDPRMSQGMGVTYSTNPQGSDNTSGFCFFTSGDKPEGAAQASFEAQVETAAFDSIGLCGLVGFHISDEFPNHIVTMMNLRLGTNFKDLEDILKIGRAVLKTEFEYNNLCGISVFANRLPHFFYREGVGENNTKFAVPNSELDSLYTSLRE